MDGTAWATSAMVAARTRLDIATENLANVSTDGFRRIDARGFLTATGAVIERERSAGHGALRYTGRAFDLAIVGPGAFRVRDAGGRTVQTRSGAFVRGRDGVLRDAQGRVLLGRHGALRAPEGATIDARGQVMLNGRVCDRIELPSGGSIHAGYLETASVDAISEMIDVMEAQRSFETAEKVMSAIDGVRQKASGTVAEVR